MITLRLLPTIFWCSLPIFLQNLLIAITFTLNLLWINHHHTSSINIIIGCSFGQSFFIIFILSLLISITRKPLTELTLIALSYRDFINVGIFLQRSFLITNILFILIGIMFFYIDVILKFIFTSLDSNKNDILSEPYTESIDIIRTYLLILLCGLYPLCIYYSIESFLFSQNLIKYSLCGIIFFGIIMQVLSINLFDNNGDDDYIEDIVSLSINFLINTIIITSLLILYCCGCNRSSLKKRILNISRKSEHNDNEYLLDNTQRSGAKNKGNLIEMQQEQPRTLSIYSKGSIHQIHTLSYNTFTPQNNNTNKGNDAPISPRSNDSATSSIASTIIENPWFHVPTWKGWDFKLMFNYQGLKQYLKLSVKYLIIECMDQWIIYFILIFVSSIISINSLLAQCLTFNMLYILMTIPISLSYSCNQLIVQKLHNQSHNNYGYNDIWDTIIAIWLLIICIIIIIIFFCTQDIIKFYLPHSNVNNNNGDENIFDLTYNDLEYISIPWMCIFVILYGIIVINHGVLKCLNLSVKGYGILNSLVFLVSIPVTFWLIYNDDSSYLNIPHLLTSLNGVWFSLCCCCVIILFFSIYKRFTINWRYESKQYIKRKIKQKQRYKYDIHLQRGLHDADNNYNDNDGECCEFLSQICYYCTICICCNCCCYGHLKKRRRRKKRKNKKKNKVKSNKIHDERDTNSFRNGYQRVHDGNNIDLYNGDNNAPIATLKSPKLLHAMDDVHSNSSNDSNNTTSTAFTNDTETTTQSITTPMGSPKRNKKQKHKHKKKKNKKNQHGMNNKYGYHKRTRSLKQVRSWSSLDNNPYYQSSEDSENMGSSLNPIDNDDTLLLKTDSDDDDDENNGNDNNGNHSFGNIHDEEDDDDYIVSSWHNSNHGINENAEYDTFEQYRDGLDALDDDDGEDVSSSDINRSMDDDDDEKYPKYKFKDNNIKKKKKKSTNDSKFNSKKNTKSTYNSNYDDEDSKQFSFEPSEINAFNNSKKGKINGSKKLNVLNDDDDDEDDHKTENSTKEIKGSYKGIMSKSDMITNILMSNKLLNDDQEINHNKQNQIRHQRTDSIDSEYSDHDDDNNNNDNYQYKKDSSSHRLHTMDSDDNNTITTMDSMEDQQMLNDLQSDSSSIQEESGD